MTTPKKKEEETTVAKAEGKIDYESEGDPTDRVIMVHPTTKGRAEVSRHAFENAWTTRGWELDKSDEPLLPVNDFQDPVVGK